MNGERDGEMVSEHMNEEDSDIDLRSVNVFVTV